jgi:hypothetical protein
LKGDFLKMAEHRFVYTVSGVELSEAQKATISREIAVAVTRAVLGDKPELLRQEYLTLHQIAGGRMIPTAEAARLPGGINSAGCGGPVQST